MTTDTAPTIATRVGHVAVLTLNRPRSLNAVDAALATAAGHALAEAAADPEVRAIVLTGAGRAFCAGADLREIAAGRDISAAGHPEWGFAGIVRQYVTTPVVAAVNGPALGGGAELVLAADLAVADEGAVLGFPEVTRGLFAAAGGVLRLQRQVPEKVALELALTGDPIDARTAQRIGLVNRVVPAGTALEEALALAERIAANAPLAVAASKDLLRRSAALGSDWDDAVWQENARHLARVVASDDALEGPTAFAEKRPPVWRGR